MLARPQRLCALQHAFQRTHPTVDDEIAVLVDGDVLVSPGFDVQVRQGGLGGVCLGLGGQDLGREAGGFTEFLRGIDALGGEFLLVSDHAHRVASNLEMVSARRTRGFNIRLGERSVHFFVSVKIAEQSTYQTQRRSIDGALIALDEGEGAVAVGFRHGGNEYRSGLISEYLTPITFVPNPRP
jgi:hypothetical protein